jgi:hypothetical protein
MKDYRTLSAFLQGVAGTTDVVRLEAREWVFLNRRVWGVLLSTHLQGDALHFVWVEAARRLLPNPQEQATAQDQQQRLYSQLREVVEEAGITTEPAWNPLPPSPSLCPGASPWQEEGGKSHAAN